MLFVLCQGCIFLHCYEHSQFVGYTRIQSLLRFCLFPVACRSVMNFGMNFHNCLGFSFLTLWLFLAISCDYVPADFIGSYAWVDLLALLKSWTEVFVKHWFTRGKYCVTRKLSLSLMIGSTKIPTSVDQPCTSCKWKKHHFTNLTDNWYCAGCHLTEEPS